MGQYAATHTAILGAHQDVSNGCRCSACVGSHGGMSQAVADVASFKTCLAALFCDILTFHQAAGNEWNELDLGITFAAATDRQSANFYLVYEESPPRSTVLAQAFFPNEVNQDVIVYSYAFEAEAGGYPMQSVFVHELGHVLGLRHEFALDPETFEGAGAVRVFGSDPNSVMSYRAPPTMQESDREGTKAFYELR